MVLELIVDIAIISSEYSPNTCSQSSHLANEAIKLIASECAILLSGFFWNHGFGAPRTVFTFWACFAYTCSGLQTAWSRIQSRSRGFEKGCRDVELNLLVDCKNSLAPSYDSIVLHHNTDIRSHIKSYRSGCWSIDVIEIHLLTQLTLRESK